MHKKFLLTITALAISPLASPVLAMKIPGFPQKHPTEEKYEGYYGNNTRIKQKNKHYQSKNKHYKKPPNYKYKPKTPEELKERNTTSYIVSTLHNELNEFTNTPHENFIDGLNQVSEEDIKFIYGDHWTKKDFYELNKENNQGKHNWN